MLSEKNGPRAPEIKIYDVYNEWSNPFPTNSLRPLLSQMADVRLEPRLANLLTFHTLFNFAREEQRYFHERPIYPNKCKKLMHDLYGTHPKWYNITRTIGEIIGLAGGVSMWFGWEYVLGSTVHADKETSRVLASLISSLFIPYMMRETGRAFARTTALVKGYRLEKEEFCINIEDLNYRPLRSIVDILHLLVSIPTMFPSAILGADGIVYGYDTLDFINKKDQEGYLFFTLVPSMMAFGAAEHNRAGPYLQKIITRLKSYNSKDVVSKAQQHASTLLKKADEWVMSLRGDIVISLGEYLKSDDPKTWFSNLGIPSP